jgi:hypothetical protein
MLAPVGLGPVCLGLRSALLINSVALARKLKLERLVAQHQIRLASCAILDTFRTVRSNASLAQLVLPKAQRELLRAMSAGLASRRKTKRWVALAAARAQREKQAQTMARASIALRVASLQNLVPTRVSLARLVNFL